MKKIIFLILGSASMHFSFSQSNMLEKIVPKYHSDSRNPLIQIAEIPVDFDQSKLLFDLPKELKASSIIKIDLVYTTFKENPEFDQNSLNQQRIKRLKQVLPAAKNELTSWRIIGQSLAKTKEDARIMFHGFVIYYHPEPTKESMEKEISYMDIYLGEKSDILNPLLKKSTTHSELKSTSSDNIIINYGTDSKPYNNLDWLSKMDFDVVKVTFERNPNWINTLVIMDVTGSMSPYIAKTMAWVKATQDSTRVDAFVFFNDGDAKPTNQKVVGKVGGIYAIENKGFDLIYGVLKSTMRKGGGGDAPENNVEATIKAVSLYPNCKEVIMVADNWASPRDLQIAKELNCPVHVIICGSNQGINLDYIQLAYETGGSIHTIEEDMEMRNIKSGKSFHIGKQFFTIIDGKVRMAKNKF